MTKHSKKCKRCGGTGYKQLSYLDRKIPCSACHGTGVTIPSFKCPKCGMVSFNIKDIVEQYCGNCHEFFLDKETKYMAIEVCVACGHSIGQHFKDVINVVHCLHITLQTNRMTGDTTLWGCSCVDYKVMDSYQKKEETD